MTYDPDYVPTGPNNKANPYYKKYNNVRIARQQETRAQFIGGPAPVLPTITVTGGAITTFNRGGVDYTQVLWRQSGEFVIVGEAQSNFALIAGGGSGGVVGQSPGAGGAGGCLEHNIPLQSGEYVLQIGAGGPGLDTNSAGNTGSDSVLLHEGVQSLVAFGGGGGGAANAGSPGGCGGGGGTNGTTTSGGAGSQGGNGGASRGDASGRGSGGGGGMGGHGADAQEAHPGNGGPGITLSWTEPPMDVCGGGGGVSNSALAPVGEATHGGTAGSREAKTLDASNGGGSGAGGATIGSGNGGDGLFVLVVESANVVVEEA